MAKGKAGVVHPRHILGLMGIDQTLEEIDDPPGSGCVFATTRGEGARDQRKECAIDERVAIN